MEERNKNNIDKLKDHFEDNSRFSNDPSIGAAERLKKHMEEPSSEEQKNREKYFEETVNTKINQENQKLQQRNQNRVETAEKKGNERHSRRSR